MNDLEIVKLFWKRDESAISESDKKYGKYLSYIAKNILASDSDSEECVNDTYSRAWGCIPPHKPTKLGAFLGKITRNLALDRYNAQRAQKRGGASAEVPLCELEAILSESEEESPIDSLLLKQAINSFLEGLDKEKRIIFLQRYWYFASIKEIAKNQGLSESNVKVILSRLRDKLKKHLEKEGIRV
ncbi:MAG: sigma-70 family RNA polymerase sigma factor [Clostridia bacterium]|nr:sigma-70 family RNA polymerase sigma factor [Clostridia bacterium]